MYQLFVSQNESILEVKPLKKVFHHLKDNIGDDVTNYNSDYYFCNKRKLLIEFAKKMKQDWLEEAEAEVRRIQSIQIK